MTGTGYVVSPGGTIRKIKTTGVTMNVNGTVFVVTEDGKRVPSRDVHVSRNYAIGHGQKLIAERVAKVQAEVKAIEEFNRNLMEKPE